MSEHLDFFVIGAQKAGTTTLWHLLKDHPQLVFPPAKEAPFFTDEAAYASGLDAYIRRTFGDVDHHRLLGTVTPHYMLGGPQAPVPVVAQRIARALPGARLVALLRDPVERAVSQWKMSRRWGDEERDATTALAEGLRADVLLAGRSCPTGTNSYIPQGEYGRILGEYLKHVPRQRLHVELTSELADHPTEVVARVLTFLEVDATWAPADPEIRSFEGGARPRVDRAASDALYALLLRDVFPLAGPAHDAVAHAFWLAYQQWNVVPDDEPIELAPDVEAALREHFAADGHRAQELLGIQLPWLSR